MVPKYFMDRGSGGGGGGGVCDGLLRFYVKTFYLTVPKNFVVEFFCVSEELWCRKFLWIRGFEGVSRLYFKAFCLTVPNYFVGDSFKVSIVSGIEKS